MTNFETAGKIVHREVRRYKWLLTILGTLIVFVSYVLKEGQLEDLKALQAAIRSAKTTVLIRKDIASLGDQLRASMKSQAQGNVSLDIENDMLRDQWQFIHDSLDNLTPLADGEERKQIAILNTRADKLWKTYERFDERIDDLDQEKRRLTCR